MKYNNGFTLWELVIAICIVAIIANLAIPMMNDYIFERRSKIIATEIEDSFRFARSESLRLDKPVTICAASITIHNVLHGCQARSKNTDWSLGMLSFIDKDNSFIYDPYRRIRYTLFDNSKIGNLFIRSSDGFYVVNTDTSISNKDDNKHYFCFWFSQNSMKTKLENIFVLNRYGVGKFCTANDLSNCEKLCVQ